VFRSWYSDSLKTATVTIGDCSKFKVEQRDRFVAIDCRHAAQGVVDFDIDTLNMHIDPENCNLNFT